MSKSYDWTKSFPGAITVTDADGTIVAMNDFSIEQFANDGGADLLGEDILDCHPEPSKSMLADMMKTETGQIYTIEKKGKKKIVVQQPWYEDGVFSGFVEMSFELPEAMPHHNRDK